MMIRELSQPTNCTNQESNHVRAANFLQLANNNFVVGNTTFQLSFCVLERMSIQSFKQQSDYKRYLWIDGGTNVSAMGDASK